MKRREGPCGSRDVPTGRAEFVMVFFFGSTLRLCDHAERRWARRPKTRSASSWHRTTWACSSTTSACRTRSRRYVAVAAVLSPAFVRLNSFPVGLPGLLPSRAGARPYTHSAATTPDPQPPIPGRAAPRRAVQYFSELSEWNVNALTEINVKATTVRLAPPRLVAARVSSSADGALRQEQQARGQACERGEGGGSL